MSIVLVVAAGVVWFILVPPRTAVPVGKTKPAGSSSGFRRKLIIVRKPYRRRMAGHALCFSTTAAVIGLVGFTNIGDTLGQYPYTGK